MRRQTKHALMLLVLLFSPGGPSWASRVPNATEKLALSDYSVWSVGKSAHGCWSLYVRDPEGFMYHLQVGDYIGREDGKVDKIDDSGIEVIEVVSGPEGQF